MSEEKEGKLWDNYTRDFSSVDGNRISNPDYAQEVADMQKKSLLENKLQKF